MPSEDSYHNHADPDPPTGEFSLEQVLDQYLEELARGNSPDQQWYLDAHPRLADALRGVFKTLDFVEATSKSLNAAKLERGQQLGEYRIIREVGRGGMGVVYEAVQGSLNRRVALKVLPTGAMLSGNAQERFLREAATAGRLHHTNIVPVFAVGEEQGIHYYTMQFIEGRSLAEHLRLLRAEGTTPGEDYFRRVAQWGRHVAEALAHAHSEGTIHRDIKPSNLLLDARDNVWVTDFGLARGDAHTTITVSGDVIGTARYMSPEQARGGRTRLDERTDIYSLGATLYELLAMTPAFDGESREAVLNRIVFADPAPLRQVNPAIPRDLETIVGKCMEKESDRRYVRAVDVAEDCRRFVAGEPIRARRTPAVVKAARFVKRHRLQAVGVVLVVGLAATVWLMAAKSRRVQGGRFLDQAYDALLFERDPDRAVELLGEAAALGVDSAELYLCRGLVPAMNNAPQRAIGPLKEALARDPDNVEVCYALAFAYSATGDAVNGQRYFKHNAGREVRTALAWLLRGLALGEEGGEDVIAAYNRALELRSDFIPAIEARAFYRADRLLTQGDRSQLEPMLEDFNAWVTFWPDSPRSYAARGSGWMFAGAHAASSPDLKDRAAEWLANSRSDFDRALALDKGYEDRIAGRYGTLLRYLGDFEGCVELFGRGMRIGQEKTGEVHPGFVHHHALALHALGKFEPALEEVEPACAELPTFVPLPLQRALLLAELGRIDEARAVCRDTLEAYKDSAVSVFIAAAVTELLGDAQASAKATAVYERARRAGSAAIDFPKTEPALEYLSGRWDSERLMAHAADHPGLRCECSFLVAGRELGRGNRQAGLAALQTCLDTHVFNYIQYRFAQVFAARIEADPSWPPWAPAADKP